MISDQASNGEGGLGRPGTSQINITTKEVHQLLKLQELFHSRYMTEELLSQMVSLYVKFTQNIQYNQHPLRIFFMEKIKFVLSRPQVTKILEKDGGTLRETVAAMRNSQAEEEARLLTLTEQAKKEVQRNHIKTHKKGNDENLRDRERNMKIEMQMKIMEEVQQNVKQLTKQYRDQQQNSSNIKQLFSKQDQDLDQRRAKRRKKRNKSAGKKEVMVVEEVVAFIAKEDLKSVQEEVRQTYQKFKRLTQHKTMRVTGKAQEGAARVDNRIQQIPKEEEDTLFDSLGPPLDRNPPPPASFKKKSKVSEQQERGQTNGTTGTAVEYGTFDNGSKERVTTKVKQYQQVEEQDWQA